MRLRRKRTADTVLNRPVTVVAGDTLTDAERVRMEAVIAAAENIHNDCAAYIARGNHPIVPTHRYMALSKSLRELKEHRQRIRPITDSIRAVRDLEVD